MLSALGIGGAKKRWAPAAKLQKDGKISKKSIIEYLQFGASQIASAESVQAVANLAKDKPDEKKYIELINDWQCQLIENRGFELSFGRMSLDEWKNTAGAQGHPKCDPKVVEAFESFERSIQITMACSGQLREIRTALQLGDDGEDNSEAVMPRRTDKAEKLQVVGPIPRQKMILFCETARDLVLSLETRRLLGDLLKEYSTWKLEKQIELCNQVILRWQYDLWEIPALAVDLRLGIVELSRCVPQKGEEDFMRAQKSMFLACQALTAWFSFKPNKEALPRAEGRRYEPWSLADEAFKEERAGVLFNEGVMETKQFVKILRIVVDTVGSEEHGKIVEEVAFAADLADLRAGERLTFEVYEACGLEHRYGNILIPYFSMNEEVQKLAKELGTNQQAVKTRISAGLRKHMEAKKAATDASGGYPVVQGA